MLKVISKFVATAIVPADSGGTYVVNAGSPVTLSAGNTHPSATYLWDLGDGTVANTPTVVHTYADNGIYIAKLKVTVNQPGGAVSRHFAVVEARNVPPVVNAGPDRTCDEGDLVNFVGTFTDAEYPDTHEATWDWGDYQKPDPGTVTETNTPPRAEGTVTGSHAWGDNGTYTVTLTVRDKDGGVGRDTLTVTVLNVPPTVDAGPDLFAYRCTVITLTGRFTDPGWLDTHVGAWDFGDCTPEQPAVVREKNDPPKGVGVAIASHTYQTCGTFLAKCTVIDDDGGVGTDTVIVRVVDVENAGFERGFRHRQPGAVGNSWEPYRAEVPVYGAPPAKELGLSGSPEVFYSAEFPVHGGQRAQRVRFDGVTRYGIRQQVGANAGWDYQITAWYSNAENSTGTARLGIDADGGTDPTAPGIVWSDGANRTEWRQLSVRATSRKGGFITVFLEALGADRGECDVFFDDVALLAVQPFCEPSPTTTPDEPHHDATCVDFSSLKPDTRLPPVFDKDTFTFSAMDRRDQVIVAWGLPAGASKLALHAGVIIDLPFPAEWVRVTVYAGSRAPIAAVALDAAGRVVAQVTVTAAGAARAVELTGRGIRVVEIRGGGEEVALIELCARRDSAASDAPPNRSKRMADGKESPLRPGRIGPAGSDASATRPTDGNRE